MTINRMALAGAAFLALATGSGAALARDPVVGGAAMHANKTIVENAGASKEHTTLVSAVKAAGLTDTLSGPGPFTVFAPTNAAFAKLPKGSVDNLLMAENKAQLRAILTYHVIPGAYSTGDLLEQIKAGGGKATLKTVQGEPLTLMQKGRTIEIKDAKNQVAHVTTANVKQSNGVVYVVDTVLLP